MTVLWGPACARGPRDATSAYGTGNGSRNWGHLRPQGRVFAGLVRGGGGCRPLGPSRWHSWDHPALGGRAADALLSPSLKLTFGLKRSLQQRAAAFAVKAAPAGQLRPRDLWPLSCQAARARVLAGHRVQLLPAPGACAGLGATAAQPHAHGSIAAAPTPRGAALGVTGPRGSPGNGPARRGAPGSRRGVCWAGARCSPLAGWIQCAGAATSPSSLGGHGLWIVDSPRGGGHGQGQGVLEAGVSTGSDAAQLMCSVLPSSGGSICPGRNHPQSTRLAASEL